MLQVLLNFNCWVILYSPKTLPKVRKLFVPGIISFVDKTGLSLNQLANVGVPLLLKQLVDAMTPGMNPATAALLVVPVGLLLAYGGLRLCTTLFTELREVVFA